MGEEALSLTVVAPPRTGKAEIEAIYDAEPDALALQTRFAILASLSGIKAPKVTVRELPKLDWLKKVSEDFPPLPIGRWVVYGAQHKAAAAECRRLRSHGCGEPTTSAYRRVVAPYIGLQIDATSAFGTGEHPTTRGCLLMLDWTLKQRRAVAPNIMLDMGCGSGILAMAFAKATHGQAVGVDLDPDSVKIAHENIRANGLRLKMRVALGNGYKAALVRQKKPFDLIMANIFAGPLCEMAYSLKQHLNLGGMVILSGLLTHQANRVIAAHRMQGLRLVKHMKIGEWSVLALQRPTRAI